MYILEFTDKSLKDLKMLDNSVNQRIVDKLEFYSVQENPLVFAKKLVNSDLGDYRFRVGDYRIIFDLGSKNKIKILKILKVAHRREIYNC